MDGDVRQTILAALRELASADQPVYLIGGAVRDQLLGRPAHDLDFALPGETRRVARALAHRLHGALYVMDAERDTTRVILGTGEERLLLDFAALRAADLEGDLRARDFTINAMAIDVANPERLIDPTGGLADLREGVIRACSPTSLAHDPVRVLRAIRQALAFHLKIEPETLRLVRAAAPGLAGISAERGRDELFRMLDGAQVSLAVRLLDQVGALEYVLPELVALKEVTQSAPHVSDVWEHTLSVTQYLEQLYAALVGKYQEENAADLTVGSAVIWLGRYRDRLAEHFSRRLVPDRSLRSLLSFAALYHDIGKPSARQVTAEGRVRFLGHEDLGAQAVADRAQALALSAAEVTLLEKMVKGHMRVHHLANALGGPASKSGVEIEPLSRRSIYRFFKSTGDAGVDICLLSLADLRGTYGTTLPQGLWEAELGVCRQLLEAYWEKSAEVVSPPRYLTGHDVMEIFGLKPGRSVGYLLADIREAQAIGEIHDREEALAFASRWMERHFASEETSRDEGEG